MQNLSERVKSLSESETLKMAKLSRELTSKGHDIINLNLGEPDFNTPDFIKEAAKKAIDDNFSHYTPVAGYADLRKAISDKFKRENDLDFSPEQTLVSTGAKQSISNAILALIDPGDEVLVPVPYWVSYKDMISMAGGKTVFLPSGIENKFKITAEQVEKAITPKTKMFLFSSPCNPSGVVFSKKELADLAAVFAKHPNIYIVSDEIYEHITFTGRHESIAQFDSIKERTIVVNGLSKSFAMTGWRIGYIGAPKWITDACEKIQGQVTSGASSIAQRAAIAGLNGDLSPTLKMKEEFLKRKELIVSLFSEIRGAKFIPPDGAFYLFPDVSFCFGKSFGDIKISNANDLSMYLLNTANVSVVSGDAFGDGNCIRISYAASPEKIKEGVRRISAALGKLD